MPKQDFKSSFIPQEADTDSGKRRKGSRTNLFIVISGLLAAVVAVAAVGTFLYKQYNESQLANKKQQLEQARANFDPALIDELSRLSSRINTAQSRLTNHTVYSPVFQAVEESTLAGVQFNSMSISQPTTQGQNQTASSSTGAQVTMQGIGQSYAAVALQSEALGDHENIMDPILSDFGLNDAGNVQFSVEFVVPESVVRYRNTI